MSCKYDSDCSNHGICNQTCKCYDNYAGDFCEVCKSDQYEQFPADGYCLLKCDTTCSGNYKCKSYPEVDSNVCDCSIVNANPDKGCGYCKTGFSVVGGNTCIPRSCVSSGQTCGGQGECIEDNGFYSCECKAGFIGTFCDYCDTFLTKTRDGKCLPEECVDSSSKECAGRGKCDVPEKECVCNHSYAGRQCTDCSIGFREYDAYYEIECLSEKCFKEGDTLPCSENGDCLQAGTVAFCECYDTAEGELCEICLENYSPLTDGGYCMPEACTFDGDVCAGFGACYVYSGVYKCVCNDNFDDTKKCSTCFEGYTFIIDQCIPDDCNYNNTECNFHGYCLTADETNKIYKCICEDGYQGLFCNECNTNGGFLTVDGGMCAQPECVINNTACSNNGECYESWSDGWLCDCNFGASGDFCENCSRDYLIGDNGSCILEDCYSQGKECTGNGYCSNINQEHRCICNSDDLTKESRCSECIPGLTLKNGVCVTGSNNKLSGGAIAGIVIAILIIIIAIGVGIYFGMKNKSKVTMKNVPQDGLAAKASNGSYN